MPKAILDTVNSGFSQKQGIAKEDWWQRLAKHYPHMPPEDQTEIYERYYSPSRATLTPKSEWSPMVLTMRLYVLEKYTEFHSGLTLERDKEAISNIHRKADKILSTWRGD